MSIAHNVEIYVRITWIDPVENLFEIDFVTLDEYSASIRDTECLDDGMHELQVWVNGILIEEYDYEKPFWIHKKTRKRFV